MARGRPRTEQFVAAGPADRWSAGSTRRHRYLDNLKVVLIAAIIAGHGIVSYATLEVWTYTEMREVTLTPPAEIALVVAALPFGLFLIALLFLVAGLLTVPSIDRKGPGKFARDRLVRLGVPFAVYVLMIQPAVVYALEHPLGYAPGTYWEEFLGNERILDTGPLWFVGVLLIYSLAYAGWVHLRGPGSATLARTIRAGHLALAAAVVAPASFAIRLVYPYGGDAGFTDLNFWQWPACIAVFTLGITAARRGWTDTVPDRLRRTCRAVTLVAVAAMAALMVTAGLTERVQHMMGGPNVLAVLRGPRRCLVPVRLGVAAVGCATPARAPSPPRPRPGPHRLRRLHPADAGPHRPGPRPPWPRPSRRGQSPHAGRRGRHRQLRPGLAGHHPHPRPGPHPLAGVSGVAGLRVVCD